MATYTHHYSQYPNEIYTLHNFKDADDSIGPVVNTVKEYMAQGNYSMAQFYMQQNIGILEPYVLNTEHINMIEEELRNLEIYAKGRQQAVFYQSDEPAEVQIQDVWIA